MSSMFQEQITNLVKSKRFKGTEYAICINSGSMRIKKSKISDDADINEVFKSIYEVTMSISSYHELPITKIILKEEKAKIVDAFKIYTKNEIKITVV